MGAAVKKTLRKKFFRCKMKKKKLNLIILCNRTSVECDAKCQNTKISRGGLKAWQRLVLKSKQLTVRTFRKGGEMFGRDKNFAREITGVNLRISLPSLDMTFQSELALDKL
jgi:hypothetical protein